MKECPLPRGILLPCGVRYQCQIHSVFQDSIIRQHFTVGFTVNQAANTVAHCLSGMGFAAFGIRQARGKEKFDLIGAARCAYIFIVAYPAYGTFMHADNFSYRI